jgi:hypothetical protein
VIAALVSGLHHRLKTDRFFQSIVNQEAANHS